MAHNSFIPQTDCAQCAYKHYSAALALLTSCIETPGSAAMTPGVVHPRWMNVLLARAYILATEATVGYPGNYQIALGCLAAAEAMCPNPEDRTDLRRLRVEGYNSPPERLLRGLRGLVIYPGDSSDLASITYAFAVAHIIEGTREFPESVRVADESLRFTGGYDEASPEYVVSVEVPVVIEGLQQALIKLDELNVIDWTNPNLRESEYL